MGFGLVTGMNYRQCIIQLPIRNVFITIHSFFVFKIYIDTNNERWKHRRAMFNPGFHKE